MIKDTIRDVISEFVGTKVASIMEGYASEMKEYIIDIYLEKKSET